MTVSTQRHVVLRQVVELQLDSDRNAADVQAQAARFAQATLSPLLERQCEELVPHDAVLRIDRVELNLGQIQAGVLNADMPLELERQIRIQLGEAIRQAEAEQGGRRVTRTASHLELIDHFVRTGTLPWWADPSRTRPVAASLLFLADAAPAALRSWLGAPDRNARQLRRLALSCDRKEFARLVHGLAPGSAAALLAVLAGLIGAVSTLGPADNSAAVRWEATFQAALLARLATGGAEPGEAGRFCREGAEEIGRAMGCPPGEVEAALRRDANAELAAVLTALGGDATEDTDALARAWAELATAHPAWGGLLAALAPYVTRVEGEARRGLRGWLAQARRGGAASDPAAGGLSWLQRAMEQGTIPSAAVRQWVAQARTAKAAATSGLVQAVASLLPPAERSEAGEPYGLTVGTGQAAFADTDAVYVGNAGLVLLAPFLPRFFDGLGLTRDKAFRDEAARARAIGLLQILVTDEGDPLESELPLNKVLCGAAIDDPYEFGPPVTGVEQAACAALLTAVIEQAPILHSMSLPGFRGTFLRRAGQLSARDAAWLLRVERATYDVVIARFPWPTQWVRLPWMSAPMQVDWV